MERRNFLKLAFGVAAGAAAFSAGAQAAPLTPQPVERAAERPRIDADVHPAVASTDDVARLKPEQVRWGWHHHHRHWGWRHRHWGWRHRWHHRHWRRW